MKRWVILVLLTGLFISLSGCSGGMADTRQERKHRIERIFESDMKQIVDDWDTIWLNDRSSRLTWWATE
ncbi:MAG: hypothetical protein JSV03_12605 [Planctomycetota bacterium]|nr:MAG: hypothetical protein JSV03_12605 [Planctomycetota bacterium]